MQYVAEDLSPVKKKIAVTVPADEVDAALSATIAMYRTSISLDGFRRGKVPSNIIEKRFRTEVYKEATTDLVNVHINEIIREGAFAPVSRIEYDGGELERGSEFVYSISFEVMPEFELPAYEGFEVEQEEAVVDEDEISAVVERLRSNMGEIITIGEIREPVDGEIAVLDFAAFDENGAAIAGIKADNFQLTLGEGQTLPDFETLVKSMKTGEEKEGPVAFPADFFNPEFAGRTVSMKAKLHAIKEKKLPELDEAFASKAGGFESMEKLRDSVRESYVKSRTELNRAAAQKQLLDQLLKLVDFPVPDSMLESHTDMLLGDVLGKLERQGKDLSALGKTEAQVRAELGPEAEMRARSQIFLLTVARRSGLEVSEQELDAQIRRMAIQSRQPYDSVKDYYTRNNLLFALRDRILADKGMDEIFGRAAVTMVPPGTRKEKDGQNADATGEQPAGQQSGAAGDSGSVAEAPAGNVEKASAGTAAEQDET